MSQAIGRPVHAVCEARDVICGADVIVCATNSNVPVFDGDWLEAGQHVTSIVSSNISLLKRGYVQQMRREIDDRTLERSESLDDQCVGARRVGQDARFWEIAQRRPDLAKEMVDAGQVLRGERAGRSHADQITYFKNSPSGASARRPSADSSMIACWNKAKAWSWISIPSNTSTRTGRKIDPGLGK